MRAETPDAWEGAEPRHHTNERVAPARLLDLQHSMVQHYGVVKVHGTLCLNAEDPAQILAALGDGVLGDLELAGRKREQERNPFGQEAFENHD